MTSRRVRLVPWNSLTRDGQMCRINWLAYRVNHSPKLQKTAEYRLYRMYQNLYYYGVLNPNNQYARPRQTANAVKQNRF